MSPKRSVILTPQMEGDDIMEGDDVRSVEAVARMSVILNGLELDREKPVFRFLPL